MYEICVLIALYAVYSVPYAWFKKLKVYADVLNSWWYVPYLIETYICDLCLLRIIHIAKVEVTLAAT